LDININGIKYIIKEDKLQEVVWWATLF
jgi:hypothetical protein